MHCFPLLNFCHVRFKPFDLYITETKTLIRLVWQDGVINEVKRPFNIWKYVDTIQFYIIRIL